MINTQNISTKTTNSSFIYKGAVNIVSDSSVDTKNLSLPYKYSVTKTKLENKSSYIIDSELKNKQVTLEPTTEKTDTSYRLLFDAWLNKHTSLLTEHDSISSGLAQSIELTTSYLKATRGNDVYRKFYSTYILFLRSSFDMINTQNSKRIIDALNRFDVSNPNLRQVDVLFNKIRAIGLAVY